MALDEVVLGVSFVCCMLLGLALMLLLSPRWFPFAASKLPQCSNRVADVDTDVKDDSDAEKGSVNAVTKREGSFTGSGDRREADRSGKFHKIVDIKAPPELDACGVQYGTVYDKMSKDRLWPILSMYNPNDQHVALLQRTIESLSVLTCDYLNQKLILLLCCIRISLRQLSRNSMNSALRDNENLIISRICKVAKRLKSSADAEMKEMERNLPKLIEDSKNSDHKRADDARARLARLNVQRRQSFLDILITLKDRYRSELLNCVVDDQVELGLALVLALMIEGEVSLTRFIKQRLNAIIERNSRRLVSVKSRSGGERDVGDILTLSEEALADALAYSNKPKAKRNASRLSISSQTPVLAESEEQQKDLVQKFIEELKKSSGELLPDRSKTTLSKPPGIDERIEAYYVEALEMRMLEYERLIASTDSSDPLELLTHFNSVSQSQETNVFKLWEATDKVDMEEFSRTRDETGDEVMTKVKTILQKFIEKKLGAPEQQEEILQAFEYNFQNARSKAQIEKRIGRSNDSRFCDAREMLLDEKQLQQSLELATYVFRRAAQEMMDVNLIITEEAKAKTKAELEYSINTISSHLLLTKFELHLRAELKLKPTSLKLKAAKLAKRAERSSEKLDEMDRENGSRKLDEEETDSSVKAEADKFATLEKMEALKIRDELANEAAAFSRVLEKQLCVSVGRYLANQARVENEETNTDLAHDLLDSVLKRVTQASNDAGAQAERLLMGFEADAAGLQERLLRQREQKVERIVDSLNKLKRQKENEINEHAARQIKMITKQPESLSARLFSKSVIEEKAERERVRIARDLMKVELLRHKSVLDHKTEEDSKQALQDDKKLLLIRLASICAASPADIRRFAETAAVDMPIDGNSKKALIEKLIADFRSGVSAPDSNNDYY